MKRKKVKFQQSDDHTDQPVVNNSSNFNANSRRIKKKNIDFKKKTTNFSSEL